jgi:acid phosphatase (class A)
MCDCQIPATPQFAQPVGYHPPAEWDPNFDPDNQAVGGPSLSLVVDTFKHQANLVAAPPRIGSATEFQQLLAYKTSERDLHCKDICAQNKDPIQSFFTAVLNSSNKGATENLLGSAAGDMLQIVLFQKKQPNFNRARPYQIMPELDPPFTPGHASYPSGHSAQAHTMAMVITLILKGPDGKYRELVSRCNALATEIAHNRERAGVHYPSDTAAGVALAKVYLQQLLASDAFTQRLSLAQQEWP